MCFDNHAVQLILLFYIRKCKHSLFNVRKKSFLYMSKGYLTLLLKRHTDEISNSQKLMVNLGFTVNPWIQ